MEEEKFWTKTKLVLLCIILGIIIIITLAVLLYRSNMRKKYKILESQINNAAPNYVGYEEISPEDGSFAKFSIDKLKKDYVRNSNIDDCDGYVIVRNKSEKLYYSTYISCKGIYKTKGYGSEESGKEDKQPTQSENDTKAPEIKLLGSESMTIGLGEEFKDPGATAYDKVDGDLTKSIKSEGTVDVNTVGEYTIVYSVSDKAGNTATKERKVIVKEGQKAETEDVNPPVITFTNANAYQSVCLGQKVDLSSTGVYGYTAYDDIDGNITGTVKINGDVDTPNKVGTYTVKYTSVDSSKNITTASRTYSVVECKPQNNPTPAPSGGGNNGGNSGGNSGGQSSGGGNGGSSSSSSSSSEVVRPEVNITVNVTSISSVDSLTLNVGGTGSLNASVLPSNATNKSLTYKSLNTGVATVDGNGNVRGVSRGETRVMITASNNVQKAVYIVVK